MKYLAPLAAAALLALPGLAAATPVMGPMAPVAQFDECGVSEGVPGMLAAYRRTAFRRTSCDIATETAPEADDAPVVLAAYRRS